jgi:hypothetical protein
MGTATSAAAPSNPRNVEECVHCESYAPGRCARLPRSANPEWDDATGLFPLAILREFLDDDVARTCCTLVGIGDDAGPENA